MRALLARREAELRAGARPVGWKIGINVPAVQERLGISGSVVGYLTSASLAEPGGHVDVSGWARPMLEPEVAIRVGEDGGVAALGPAIELVDVDLPFEDVEAILAGNVFHRAVLFGEEAGDAHASGACRVIVDREEAAPVPVECDPEATVSFVFDFLAAHGARLAPGERIIAGSLTPPIAVAAGAEAEAEIGELGSVAVNL